MTAQLSWHVQNFVTIRWLGMDLHWYIIFCWIWILSETFWVKWVLVWQCTVGVGYEESLCDTLAGSIQHWTYHIAPVWDGIYTGQAKYLTRKQCNLVMVMQEMFPVGTMLKLHIWFTQWIIATVYLWSVRIYVTCQTVMSHTNRHSKNFEVSLGSGTNKFHKWGTQTCNTPTSTLQDILMTIHNL